MNMICPLCQRDNHCSADETCWCMVKQFPDEIFKVVPEELLNKECICEECLEIFPQKTNRL